MDSYLHMILVQLAQGTLAQNDMDEYCLYCDGDSPHPWQVKRTIEVDYPHQPTCLITQARAALTHQGTPLLLFVISYEHCESMARRGGEWIQHWVKREGYMLGTTEEEARATMYHARAIQVLTHALFHPVTNNNEEEAQQKRL